MAKVLRLHKGAADTIGNWDTSVKIGTKAIDSIADPIGANDKHELTSIPSPFARMDLVKRAFKIVAEGSLEGKTAYHKLVSDCLDVGQIFFNIVDCFLHSGDPIHIPSLLSVCILSENGADFPTFRAKLYRMSDMILSKRFMYFSFCPPSHSNGDPLAFRERHPADRECISRANTYVIRRRILRNPFRWDYVLHFSVKVRKM